MNALFLNTSDVDRLQKARDYCGNAGKAANLKKHMRALDL